MVTSEMFSKKFSFAFFILVACIVCIVVAVAGASLIVVGQRINLDPSEPNATGEFPQIPEWEFPADSRIVTTPLSHESRVFIRSEKSIYAVDIRDGNLIWRTDSPAITPLSVSPILFNGQIFVPEAQSRIATFDEMSGKPLWRSPEIDFRLGAPSFSEIESMAIDEQCLYVARNGWNLTCYDLYTGDEIWAVRVPNRVSLFLAAGSENIFLGADHYLQAYDQNNGQLLWEIPYENLVGPILFDNGILYITLSDSELIALNPDNQQLLWNRFLDPAHDNFASSLSSFENRLYVGSKKLFALEKTDGHVLWEQNGNKYFETPVELNGRLYVRNIGQSLYDFDRETGEEMGWLRIQANTNLRLEPHRGPVAGNDLLIVPFGDNRVFAYRP